MITRSRLNVVFVSRKFILSVFRHLYLILKRDVNLLADCVIRSRVKINCVGPLIIVLNYLYWGHDSSLLARSTGSLSQAAEAEQKMSKIILFVLVTYIYCFVGGKGIEITSAPNVIVRNISIVDNEFMLEGRPFKIWSGSLHYFRLPHQYWRDRLQKIKAAGLNTLCGME
ncbi:unnamed protein product [Leptidea sinapis]|uniref:Glycoside hydrolase 35 catalytic domain-containing protein n=1 Tax=Leptidea sinapis TaxID=189913 RepID=A0A5E4QE58_9NEOP|nr:unnamed protein product [Leptidea sinapis]